VCTAGPEKPLDRGNRVTLTLCVIFSGLAALLYQVIWTRLLGLSFGTTTEAIGTVLAVFFGGMALGNAWAAEWMKRTRRPLRVYGWLETGIGLWALGSFPVLVRMPSLYGLLGANCGSASRVSLRLMASALLLLPPTIAMGATLPVVARGLIFNDRTRGRWSAILYSANTLGAVLGAYGCGFWLLPKLGIGRAVVVAASVNLGVAACALRASWKAAVPLGLADHEVRASQPLGEYEPPASSFETEVLSTSAERRLLLLIFGFSGFVAIGYEIVWSKLFGIVLENTLYGFAAVLSVYLLGIAIGSMAIARKVDQIRQLPRAFGLLHLGTAVTVCIGVRAVPYLPFALQRLQAGVGGKHPVHLLLLIVTPLILAPTCFFGASFPVLIRICSRRASDVGAEMGLATAINTTGSIFSSLIIGFLAVPSLGLDATLYALLLLDVAIALIALLSFQRDATTGRVRTVGFAMALAATVVLTFPGAQAGAAVAGHNIRLPTLEQYRRELAGLESSLEFLAEGRNSIVTVHRTPAGRSLQTNGMPESALRYAPPYFSIEEVLLGVLPYLTAGSPKRALVVGLGGGNTISALRSTGISRIEVAELEPEVAGALGVLYQGRENPLSDPRVSLLLNDGRNELLIGRYQSGRRYDIIASQPSHPWLAGAASLFTEEFFALARDNLTDSGVLALWVNGFRTDEASFLAIATSFERAFPGSVLVDAGKEKGRQSLILLGGRRPLRLELATLKERLDQPDLRELLELFKIRQIEELLARFEGPTAAFAAIDPAAANTDDNAFVEMRTPRLSSEDLDFGRIEERLAPGTPVLPETTGTVDIAAVARSLLCLGKAQAEWPYARKLARLLQEHGSGIDPVVSQSLRLAGELRQKDTRVATLAALRTLAAQAPGQPEPLRVLGHDLGERERNFRAAGDAFAEAYARSHDAEDAFDAARAYSHVDSALAADFARRIPTRDRARYPRLAVYEAERAIAERADPVVLRDRLTALLHFRDTNDGREQPDLNALASRLATMIGDDRTARRFADLDHETRELRARPLLERAADAIATGQTEEASGAIAEAEQLLPGSARLAELKVRLAAKRSDPRALELGFAEVRAAAGTLAAGISAENVLRLELGLPLFPMFPSRDPVPGNASTAGSLR